MRACEDVLEHCFNKDQSPKKNRTINARPEFDMKPFKLRRLCSFYCLLMHGIAWRFNDRSNGHLTNTRL